MWDPEADPEALNERGFGIGQWRLQEYFLKQRSNTYPEVGFGHHSARNEISPLAFLFQYYAFEFSYRPF